MATTIRLRRDTASNWTANNPILSTGEPGIETDTNKIKIGNGINPWRNLNYIEYPLPVATGTTFGTVRPDGVTITVNGGILTAIGGGSGGSAGSGTVNAGNSGSLAFYPNAGTTVDDAQGLVWNSLSNIFTVNGTLSATTILGIINANNISGTLSSSVLPTATTSDLGAVKVDSTTIQITNGVISAILPVASTTVSGSVKVDGTTIIINNGVITAVGGGGGGSGNVNTGTINRLAYYPSSSNVVDDVSGVTWNDISSTLTVSGTLTATTLNGSLNASNLTGTLTSNVLPIATTLALGAVRVDGTTITINNGIISSVAVTNGVVTNGTYANPTWITSLDGNKIINGVVTTGSYANPTWITSLEGSKIINGVVTTGSYVNPSWIISLSGNKLTGTVIATNGVVTNGTYADPSWITSLDGTKVINAVLTTGSYANPSWITSLDGSKVTNVISTSGSYADPSWITSLNGNKVTNVILTTASYANPSWITSLAGSKVTDAVLITSTYVNPSWITSLDSSKLTGTISATNLPTATASTLGGVKVDGTTIIITDGVISAVGGGGGGSGTVNTGVANRLAYYPGSTNLVDDLSNVTWNSGTTTLTVTGTVTASTLNGTLNASNLTGTVVATNGVVTTSTYADPSWITSLASSKITTPSTFSITSTGTTTARTLGNRFSDFISVLDFGAAGNGTTDDTAAFQAAIDAVYALGGGIVYIPSKRFAIKTPLYLHKGVTLQGPYGTPNEKGWGLNYETMPAILINNTSPNTGIIITGSSSGIKGCFIRKDGMSFTSTSNWSGYGVYGQGFVNYFTNIVVNNGLGTATYNATPIQGQPFIGSYITINFADTSGSGGYNMNGFYKVTASTATTITFNTGSIPNGTYNGQNFTGFLAQQCDNVSIEDCFIMGFSEGIRMVQAARLRVFNCNLDNLNCINLAGSGDVSRIEGVTCTTFATLGVASVNNYSSAFGQTAVYTYTVGFNTTNSTITGTGLPTQLGQVIIFANNGNTLPTGLFFDTYYYVVPFGSSTTQIQISATLGGSPITISNVGSGTHKMLEYINCRTGSAITLQSVTYGSTTVTCDWPIVSNCFVYGWTNAVKIVDSYTPIISNVQVDQNYYIGFDIGGQTTSARLTNCQVLLGRIGIYVATTSFIDVNAPPTMIENPIIRAISTNTSNTSLNCYGVFVESGNVAIIGGAFDQMPRSQDTGIFNSGGTVNILGVGFCSNGTGRNVANQTGGTVGTLGQKYTFS